MSEETQEVQESVPEQVEEQGQVQENQEQEAPKKSADHNWQEARRLIEEQQRRIAELDARLSQKQQPVQEEEDELEKLDLQDYVTVEKAMQIAEKKATKAAKKLVDEYVQQQRVLSSEDDMRKKYQDYDYVINNFTLPALKNDPALVHKVQTSRNPAETAYKLGRLSDEYEDTGKQEVSPRSERIMKNASRPVSSNAAASPLKGQADQFSKMSKEEIWKQSEKFARGA